MKKGQVDTQFQVQATLDILPLFDVFVEPYKTVNGHPIEAHILVPKGTSVSDSPVLVKLHGGGWHEGNSDHWWRPW